MWLIVLGKASTQDLLQCRGITLVNRCCLYCHQEESISHLFMHGSVASLVWGSIFRQFHRSWVLPRSWDEFLEEWAGSARDDLLQWGSMLWGWAPFSVCWTLWLERNDRTFNDSSTAVLSLPEKIIFLLFHWNCISPLFANITPSMLGCLSRIPLYFLSLTP